MKVFDFNIHLPTFQKDSKVEDLVHSEMIATNSDLIDRSSLLKPKLYCGNFMIFNPNLFEENNKFIDYINNTFKNSSFTLLVDFRDPNVFSKLETAISSGIHFIKFHSYHQGIDKNSYEKIIKICKYAEKNNIKICLDGSYGTSKMLKYDIIDLICTISDKITKVPIIVSHSGGIKCLEVMLLALEKPNVFVETSFSLPFYLGSSIEKDLAFAYSKIDSNKILYGSDTPYVSFDDSLNKSYLFFRKWKMENKIEDIFYNNAIKLCGI